MSNSDKIAQHVHTPNIDIHKAKSGSFDDDDEDDQDLVLSSGLNLVGATETGRNVQEIQIFDSETFLCCTRSNNFSAEYILIALMARMSAKSSIHGANGTNIH